MGTMPSSKPNLLPLIAIAFVVALISTGVFYGLVVGRVKAAGERAAKAADPTAGADPAGKEQPKGGVSLSVPKGLRAVSVRVTDSGGVVARLETGFRVDVHVISRRGEASELRTVLENLEVLWRDGQEPAGRGQQSVVTLLATPKEAETLSLADALSQIRLVLRNPGEPARQAVVQAVAPSPPRKRVVRNCAALPAGM